ncbi:MAG: NADH oxidase [Gammaproteobacteria bacterium]|nr:MAG: NADH oxidase [Gammaproteobacteria bacterium]
MSVEIEDIDPFSQLALSPAETLAPSLELPCGVSLKNRFFKSAMNESLASVKNEPGELLINLYRRWAEGGAGVLVTGNVMVDRAALGAPRSVALEDGRAFDQFVKWAQAGKQNNTHVWMQLNHPGKQVPKVLSSVPVAPSAIPLNPSLSRFFNQPRALLESEIEDIIQRFAKAASIAKKAGFTGVQIHGAHGYLVSQFLSAKHNQRTDKWGGNAVNRMRFVTEVYKAIRAEVGGQFPVSIKLNSADFQRGGFTEKESIDVVKALSDLGIDLLEISGGTYESPAMTGVKADSTRQREAYFLGYAEQVRRHCKAPLVVTGGFRSAQAMGLAVSSGNTDMVGLARPMSVDPDIPNKILAGEDYQNILPVRKTGIGIIDKMAMLEVTWYERQLERIARGRAPKPNESALGSLIKTMLGTGLQVYQRQRSR